MSSVDRPTELRRLYERDSVRGMVPTMFLRVLAEHLRRQGVEPASIMPPDALKPSLTSLGRYPAEAWCQLLLRTADRLQDPLLGLHLGQSIQPAHFGALGYLLLACDNLGAAILRIQRYHRLVHDLNPIRSNAQGDALVLQWGVARGKPGALFDETGISALVQCGRLLCGRRFEAREVDFVNPPPTRTQPFADFLGGRVRWNQSATRLVIGLDVVQLPLQRPDATLRHLMEEQIDEAMSHLPETGDVVELTQQVVRRLAAQGAPELEQVAAELRRSPRSLYRALADRGRQFRQLRDEALRELAETHLRDTRLSLAEVSSRLGYTEQSAFTRAFKRWSGQTPLSWRQKNAGRP